jgi:hypothetical protein
MTNNDVIKGIVSAMTDASLTLTPVTGDPVEVPTASIAQLMLAAPPGGRKPNAPAPFLLRLANGTNISCSTLTFANDQFDLTPVGGGAAHAAVKDVIAVEQSGGPVAWLSARTPVESIYTPFFEGKYTPRMDRTVTDEPIRFGNVTYARGIGVHSKTRLTWKIEPGDQKFRTRYAIDPTLGYANVDVRVLVDDKVVHEQQGVKAGTLSPVIEADLTGGKQLTLEVDYGKGYDVQDRLNWIEPAIIRKP